MSEPLEIWTLTDDGKPDLSATVTHRPPGRLFLGRWVVDFATFQTAVNEEATR